MSALHRALSTARFAAVVLACLLTVVPFAYASDASRDIIGGRTVGSDAARAESAPRVAMPSGVLWTGDGRALWERDPHAERAMASTTKIMTALVVLESADLADTVVVSAAAARVGEAGVGLYAGQRITVGELLEAMLVRSGNDASVALAEHVAGSVDGFVGLMNDKARSLGLEQTAFTNPHGLDAAGHHTSAADLATLSAIAMADERFASAVRIPRVTLTRADGTRVTYENSNKLLTDYAGATGVKTGWTSKAGYCVVASAERNGISLLAVVLGGTSEDDRFDQAKTLFDWAYAHYAMTAVSSAEETAALVAVSDYLDTTVAAVVAESVTVPVFDLDGDLSARVDALPEVDAPVVVGQRLGTLTVMQGERLLAQVPLVAAHDVPAPDLWEGAGIWFTRLWRSVFGGQMVAAPVAVM